MRNNFRVFLSIGWDLEIIWDIGAQIVFDDCARGTGVKRLDSFSESNLIGL